MLKFKLQFNLKNWNFLIIKFVNSFKWIGLKNNYYERFSKKLKISKFKLKC